jgi:hypothetical protein
MPPHVSGVTRPYLGGSAQLLFGVIACVGRVLTARSLQPVVNALGTLPKDGNVMPKHVGATIHNQLNE